MDGVAEENCRSAPWPVIAACRAEAVPLLALMAFSIEGDNIEDAVKLAAVAEQCLSGREGAANTGGTQWRYPESWQSLYGRPQGLAVY